jgi:L-lysine 2,3-aminomutase
MRVLMANWQEELSTGFKNAADLLAFLGLDATFINLDAEKAFKTKVPVSFAKRIQKGNRHDPILKQVLAVSEEMMEVAGFVEDALEESRYNPLPGLIHKYPNRVLLVLSGACAVHCRYCFRRHFPYEENNPGRAGWLAIQSYLLEHPEVNEVILSGGDPLLMPNQSFKSFLDLLAMVPHIKTLRIHSRIPIVLPSRIEADWISILDAYPWKKVMVTHANHAHELNHEVYEAISKLKQYDWTILNQAVLLAEVNDNVDSLVDLSQALFMNGILPYYLHLLDTVKGTAHFFVSHEKAIQLFQSIQTRLPGYLVPRLVQEKPGLLHKTLVKS